MSTLGPGATNLVTPAGYAQLGAMPMLMITGQKPIKTSKQGRFQIIDVVEGGDFDWICLYMPDYLGDLEIFGREILPRLAAKGIAPEPGTFSPLVPELV